MVTSLAIAQDAKLCAVFLCCVFLNHHNHRLFLVAAVWGALKNEPLQTLPPSQSIPAKAKAIAVAIATMQSPGIEEPGAFVTRPLIEAKEQEKYNRRPQP